MIVELGPGLRLDASTRPVVFADLRRSAPPRSEEGLHAAAIEAARQGADVVHLGRIGADRVAAIHAELASGPRRVAIAVAADDDPSALCAAGAGVIDLSGGRGDLQASIGVAGRHGVPVMLGAGQTAAPHDPFMRVAAALDEIAPGTWWVVDGRALLPDELLDTDADTDTSVDAAGSSLAPGQFDGAVAAAEVAAYRRGARMFLTADVPRTRRGLGAVAAVSAVSNTGETS